MEFYNNNELMHYGVKGMRWGVRRYQNEDGSLTKEGRRRARKEYFEDNKRAFELGRDATIYGHATAKSMNRTIKLENKLDRRYAKDPTGSSRRTQSLKKKWDASSKTTMELVKHYSELKNTAKKHCDSLIKKYGKEAVVGIQYKDKKIRKSEYGPSTFNTMNESTTSIMDYAKSAAITLGSLGMSRLLNAPFYIISTPATTGEKASRLERQTYEEYRKGMR